ncbi:hypothetical protein EGN72_02710 [Pseudorhodobacter sp. E13]|nr:hypothetical protein EGN72_02710 [Pseudorhodobacter sp. E13]
MGGIILIHRIRALLRRYGWRLADRIAPPDAPRPPPDLPRGRPLRVGFVVCEAAKWGLGSLLAHLQQMDGVEIGFYPALSDLSLRMTRAERRQDYARERAFFAGLGPVWADLYDAESDRVHEPEQIACDVAFIQQPWGMQDLPRRLSGRVRTAYVHYGMAVIRNDRMQFGLPDFHPWLWRYFLPTEAHAEAIRAAQLTGPARPKLCVTGHPKFDTYLGPAPARDAVPLWPHPSDTGRRRVIFAPHHGLERGSLGLGTFGWSGAAMLDLVRTHPQVDFLLRPHPNMAIGLARSGLMQRAEWQAYKDCWAALPNGAVHENGPYWEVFRTSDALITDSGSFLAEYLPTGQPLIRLERAGAAPLNPFGQRLSGGFYRCADAPTLARLFADVVVKREDPLAQSRAEAAALLTPFDQPSARLITQALCLLRAV